MTNIPLTPTEDIILGLLKQGLRGKEMAAARGCELKTVKYHLTNIYKKLGVTGARQLLGEIVQEDGFGR